LGANCTLAFVICLAELQTIRVQQGIWIMDPAPKACLDGLGTQAHHDGAPKRSKVAPLWGAAKHESGCPDSLKGCKCPEIKLSQTWHDTGLCECDDAFTQRVL